VVNTGFAGGDATSVNFRKREFLGAASWYEDSVQDTDTGSWSGAHTYNSDQNWTIGAPVQIFARSIPEPSTLSLNALSGLGMLVRPRRGVARQL
jgi:hypothetical protein